MSIPVTGLNILAVMLQCQQNLNGLQKDMRNNALTWKAMAQAQTTPAATVAGYMNDAATAYQTRLGWLDTLQADSPNWTKISAMWTALGGTAADFSAVTAPLKAVATQLGPVAKTTYAQQIAACDQIIAAVNAPLSLWPE